MDHCVHGDEEHHPGKGLQGQDERDAQRDCDLATKPGHHAEKEAHHHRPNDHSEERRIGEGVGRP
jgi:hypothetical protein